MTEMESKWETRVCSEQSCQVKTWVVKRHPSYSETWWVAESENSRPFLVAAHAPFCPRCGAPLLSQAELDEGIHPTDRVEGPIFYWLRQQPS